MAGGGDGGGGGGGVGAVGMRTNLKVERVTEGSITFSCGGKGIQIPWSSLR